MRRLNFRNYIVTAEKYSSDLSSWRFWLGLSLPIVVLLLQEAAFSFVSPYTWFLFFPTVLLSTQIGGNLCGIIATIESAILVWFFLIPPELSFDKTESRHFISAFVFLSTGIGYTYLQRRLHRLEDLRRLAEMDLKRRETQMEAAQEVGHFGTWYLDVRRKKAHWSDEVYRILGLTPQDPVLKGEGIVSFMHPDDRARVRQEFDRALFAGDSYIIDYRIVRPDGAVRYIHSVGKALIDRGGSPIEMVGTMTDVTSERLAQTVLRESEAKFRGLLEVAYDSILVVDEKGRIEFANRQSKTILGYNPQDLIGRPFEILLPDHIRVFHEHEWDTFIRNPESKYMGGNIITEARRKDGTNFPADIAFAPFKTGQGLVITVFIKDVTDQRRAIDQQRFLSETTRILAESLDYKSRVQKIAELTVPRMADWCTVHIKEADGLKLRASAQIPEIDAKLVWEMGSDKAGFKNDAAEFSVGSVAKSGKAKFVKKVTDEILYQIAAGEPNFIRTLQGLNIQSIISVPLKARGRNIGVISFVRCKPKVFTEKDLELAKTIGDRAAMAIDNARLYEEAQKSIRMREEILAVVSHDLKNPLNVIRGFNSLLTESLLTYENSEEDLKAAMAISRSVKQMDRLIRDLLDMSKIDMGNLDIELRSCPLHKLVWEGVEMVKRQADEKKVQLRVDIEADLPAVHCDPDRIVQVLGNILGNAIKFVPRSGLVHLRASLTPFGAQISVQDNGPGIPPEDASHVFDRYWQAKKTAKLGSGLGLSIAKGIIEGHHGKIWVESQLGRGATFYFTLPVIEGASIPQSFAQPETPSVMH